MLYHSTNSSLLIILLWLCLQAQYYAVECFTLRSLFQSTTPTSFLSKGNQLKKVTPLAGIFLKRDNNGINNNNNNNKTRDRTRKLFSSSNSSSEGSIINISSSSSSSSSMTLVKNFRKVTGFQTIYRCASTDLLGDLFDDNDNINKSTVSDTCDDNGDNDDNAKSKFEFEKESAENKLLNELGLILDLRSPSERDGIKAQKWMSNAPGGKYITENFERDGKTRLNFRSNNSQKLEQTQRKRIVYRVDVLSPSRLFEYMSKSWLDSPSQKAQYMFNAAFDSNGLHEMRMDILNERGLKGLYEAIIETSCEELFTSLKSIVEYLESTSEKDGNNVDCNDVGVAVHCVQGKDRYVFFTLYYRLL